MSAELFLKEFNHGTGSVSLQFLYFQEVRIEVNKHDIFLAMKCELVSSDSTPRVVRKVMALHWELLILSLKFVAN